ncbi:hypothetical protein ABR738_00615 [Streptomyces sp. Edi4]|uniref:hypothetical protein n=1 Tax=Streptomyces sp. Edi4 TaxID=3162527 RepID=UPI003305CCB0
MPENTDTTHMTGAERLAQDQLERRVAYAVAQLKAGKYLTLTNDSAGEVNGICGHDPHEGRPYMTKLLESGVRKWD